MWADDKKAKKEEEGKRERLALILQIVACFELQVSRPTYYWWPAFCGEGFHHSSRDGSLWNWSLGNKDKEEWPANELEKRKDKKVGEINNSVSKHRRPSANNIEIKILEKQDLISILQLVGPQDKFKMIKFSLSHPSSVYLI